MKKTSIFSIAFLLIFMITSCDKNSKLEVTQTSEISISIPDDYSKVLVRPWVFSEICESVYFDGINIGFPFTVNSLNKNDSQYTLTLDYFSENHASGIITTPDQSEIYVTWSGSSETPLDEENLLATPIMSMNVLYGYAPFDFSLYNLSFGMSVSTIYSDFGIPDDISEYVEDDIKIMELYYYGIDSQCIVLKLTNNMLVSISLSR